MEPLVPLLDRVRYSTIGRTGVDRSTAAKLTFEGGMLARVACSIQANLDSSVRIFGIGGADHGTVAMAPGADRHGGPDRVHRWEAEPEVIDIPLEAYTVEVDAGKHVRARG